MTSLALHNPSSDTTAAPTFIPPRTSSHGVAFPSASPPRSSSIAAAASAAAGAADKTGNLLPPHRKSSKRPVSSSSENWQSQSRGKKPLTESHLETIPAAHSSTRHHSSTKHSHRPKSASGSRAWTTISAKANLWNMTTDTPQQDPPSSLGDDLIHSNQSTWSDEKEMILLAPYEYLFGHPGKDIRSQLIGAFNKWLAVPEERLAIITKVVGMLHTSSLL
jgi:geranylgeranyl diphosphate synthase type 3